ALALGCLLVPDVWAVGSRWVSCGGRVGSAEVWRACGSQSLASFIVSPKQETLVVLTELIESGKVTPVIDRTYPMSETRQAIDHVGRGHARGKVVVTVSNGVTS